MLPAAIGYAWGGWTAALGAFLIAGVARVVAVQLCTFCINSLCHYIGKQTYSSRCSARDSWLMSLVTFGEGYHNYHHEFPYDYRNGVKPWQFDPTKWIIWMLSKVGLARWGPARTILCAEFAAVTLGIRRPNVPAFIAICHSLLSSGSDPSPVRGGYAYGMNKALVQAEAERVHCPQIDRRAVKADPKRVFVAYLGCIIYNPLINPSGNAHTAAPLPCFRNP